MSVSEDWMQDFYFCRVPYVMHLVSHILVFAFWPLQAILLCFPKEKIYDVINHLSLPCVVSLSIIPFHELPAYVLQSLGYNKTSDPGGALWKVAKRKRIFARLAGRRYVLNVKYVPVHLNGAMDVNVNNHRNNITARIMRFISCKKCQQNAYCLRPNKVFLICSIGTWH